MYFAVFDLELASSYLSICLCSCAQQTPSRYLSLFNDSSAIIQNRKLVHFQIRWNMEIWSWIDIWTRRGKGQSARGQTSEISCRFSGGNSRIQIFFGKDECWVRVWGKGEGTGKWDFVTGKNQDWDSAGHQVASLQELLIWNLIYFLIFWNGHFQRY